MWPDTPEQRLDYIKRRQAELIAEAAASRSVARRTAHHDHRFTGLRIRFGSLLIMIGRTLCEEDALRHDPARS
jgi:hypothetical protein